MNTIDPTVLSDEQLLRRSRDGDREAFGRIVERYQSLICFVAYSASGDLAHSQDLAQETFIAAWLTQAELRDPSKLRAWLSGIARNVAAGSRRREGRRRAANQTLDVVEEQPDADDDPSAQVVTQQEAELLWRCLEDLSEIYREPLVLFYWQGQSVAEVARLLDLKEDAVKQRLSRGRALLREELATVVEATLVRARPMRALATAVTAALPDISPTDATAMVTTGLLSSKTGVAVKGLVAGAGKFALVGPAMGLLVGLFSARAAAKTGRSPQERACIHRHVLLMILFCFAMSVGLALVLAEVVGAPSASPQWVVLGLLAWVATLASTVTWISSRMHKEVVAIRAAVEPGNSADAFARPVDAGKVGDAVTYESQRRLLGLPLLAVASGGTDPGSFGARTAIGWIALGDIAVSPLLAIGAYAVAPFAFGAITAGVFSFSIWGAAVGVVAFGSVAVGWSAYGLGALGWRAAAGGIVAAKDYAVGAIAHAAEANTVVAKEWFASQWFWSPVELFVRYGLWVLLLLVGLLVATALYRSRRRKSVNP